MLLLVVIATYAGVRVGRTFEFNRLCCGLSARQNLQISLRETVGLLKFPSQIGQDRWVAEKVFPGVRDGYFLDVGSADGVIESNTWALERRGWTGICIDPFPSNMAGRKCQMVTKVVDSVAGRTVTFRRRGLLGGIEDHMGRFKEETAGAATVQLTTVTLEDILQEAHAPSYIHFMSLDIEGAELEALKAFPFDRYSLGAMAIEHNFEEPKRSQLASFLESRGYECVQSWQQDDFYLPVSRGASRPGPSSGANASTLP